MKRILVNGKEVELELRRSGEHWEYRTGAQGGLVSIIEAEPGVYSVLINNRSFEARVAPGSVEVDGEVFLTEIVDQRTNKAPAGSSGGRQQLTAPMPGRIVRLLVQQGQTVDAGQGILVMEAMKMQNEIKATRSGTVASVLVADGAAVSAGDILAVIE